MDNEGNLEHFAMVDPKNPCLQMDIRLEGRLYCIQFELYQHLYPSFISHFVGYVKGMPIRSREDGSIENDIELMKNNAKKKSAFNVSEKSRNVEIFKLYLKVNKCTDNVLHCI